MAYATTGETMRFCNCYWQAIFCARQFLTQCFECLGIKIRFEGNGVNEVAIVIDSNKNEKINLIKDQIVVKSPKSTSDLLR